MTTTQEIEMGEYRVTVECHPVATARDSQVRALAAQTEPVPVGEWPIAPAQVSALANARLAAYGGARSQADAEWAVETATLDACTTHYWIAARTPRQRDTAQAAARRQVLRGELS